MLQLRVQIVVICIQLRIVFTTLLSILFSFQIAAATLKLSTATSIANTGLLSHILPKFTQQTGIKVDYTAVGSGAALKMGRQGKVDVLLVHAPTAKDKYMQEGYGNRREFIMFNYFVLVGPKELINSKDLSSSLQLIAKNELLFFSRGDNSGTHKKEQVLWESIKKDPVGELWYIETGLGMAATLKAADAEQGYILTDRGTWISTKDQLNLKIVYENDSQLLNPYSAIVVRSLKQKIQTELANKFVNWLLSDQGQNLIATFRVKQQIPFIPKRDQLP